MDKVNQQVPLQGGQGHVMDVNGMGSAFEGSGFDGGGGGMMRRPVGNGVPIQRVVSARDDGKLVDGVTADMIRAAKAAAVTLDALTQGARRAALNWRRFHERGGYLGDWYNCAKAFAENPSGTHDRLARTFGYAIETLVCEGLGATLEGLVVELQKTKGATRPDVVLSKDGKEVAWLDFTAGKSEGHIRWKSSTGWGNKPYVAEILYESLRPEEILTGSDDPAENALGALDERVLGIRRDACATVKAETARKLKRFVRRKKFTSTGGNQKKKAGEVRKEFFSGELGVPMGPIAARGAVAYLGGTPGHVGLGKSKESQREMVSAIAGWAAPRIKSETDALYEEERLKGQKMAERDLVGEAQVAFMKATSGPGVESARLSVVYRICQKAKKDLQAVHDQLRGVAGRGGGGDTSGAVVERMGKHLAGAPDWGSLADLKGWAAEAARLVKAGKETLAGLVGAGGGGGGAREERKEDEVDTDED